VTSEGRIITAGYSLITHHSSLFTPGKLSESINLSGLLPLLSEQLPFQQLARELDAPHEGRTPAAHRLPVEAGHGQAWRLPVMRAARPLVLTSLAQNALTDRAILMIAAKPDRAQTLYESLRAYGLATPDRLLRFPEPSALLYERAPWPREVVAERLQVLARLRPSRRL
jgi:hypothetical protein